MNKYPLPTRLLHWLTAIMVIALFFSGWYMVELDYYSPWYQTLPQLHILVGLVLVILWPVVLIRLFLSSVSFDNNYSKLERLLSQWVKRLFYLLVLVLLTTGYLMTTADGDGYVLFNFIKIPAVSQFSASQIDNMGLIHQYTAYFLMFLILLHLFGALKHHFIDKDQTLKRML